MHASDLLDQRIIEKGGFVPSYQVGSIKKAITEIIELVTMTLQEKKLTILFKTKGPLKADMPLSFDSRRLQQVVLNLLTNAVKFTPTSGNITVTMNLSKSTGDQLAKANNRVHLEVTVKDNGVGIDGS